jgi:hypothetical protein
MTPDEVVLEIRSLMASDSGACQSAEPRRDAIDDLIVSDDSLNERRCRCHRLVEIRTGDSGRFTVCDRNDLRNRERRPVYDDLHLVSSR